MPFYRLPFGYADARVDEHYPKRPRPHTLHEPVSLRRPRRRRSVR